MTVLCYHTVERGWRSPLAVTPEVFDRHCSWLARRRCVIGLPQGLGALDRHGNLPAGAVMLTFDDGFSGVRSHALPSLLRNGLTAVVFVVARTLFEQSTIDWAPTAPRSARTLTPDEILELRDAGLHIGSHSYSHLDLVELSEEECVRDLRASRESLEDLVEGPVRTLAYPKGRHSAHVRRAAVRAGFTHAFGLPEGREEIGRLSIPRAVILPGNGISSLAVKSSPWFFQMRRNSAYPVLRIVARRAGFGLRL